jgi:hypothetical protein
VLRTNNDGEFTTAKLAAYCVDEGVTRHFSVSYTPLQNGVVERRNQTVVAMAHTLLKHRGMPAEFWGEVVVTVVYLQNRLPTKSFAGRTPYEAQHGRKPAVSHLRVFGCQAFVKQLRYVDKLADRNRAGVFIGYTEGAKAYRILNPMAWQVCSARDVVFDEAHGRDWAATAVVPSTVEFTVEYIHVSNPGAAARSAYPRVPGSPARSPSFSARMPTTPPFTQVAMTSPKSAASPADAAATLPEFVTPLEDDEERLDAVHGESPMRYHTYDNIIGTGEPVSRLATRNLIEELNLASTGLPCTFAEEEQDTVWRAATQEEIDYVKRNQTWELADHHPQMGV